MFILIIVLLIFCVPCSCCGTYLFYKHVLPKMRARASAAAAASKGAGDDEKDEEEAEDIKSADLDDMINTFLDPAWLQGMDDAPDLEINPVLKYKVDEEKRAAVRAAAEAAGEGGGGSNSKQGVPGAIARLGWALDESQNASKEEQKNKEKRRAMKNIEGWVARTYEADVTYSTANTNTLAGGVKFNALEMAKRTELERVGGRRQSALMMVAQKSRSQLANYMAANPGGSNPFGVQPGTNYGGQDS